MRNYKVMLKFLRACAANDDGRIQLKRLSRMERHNIRMMDSMDWIGGYGWPRRLRVRAPSVNP